MTMKIKKLNKHLKSISIFLFGIEYGNKFPLNLRWVRDDELRSLLCEDEFGLYKKENVKIPFRFRKKYKLYKKLREEMIYAKYYHLKIDGKYGRKRQYYLVDDIEIPSESDKIVVEKLLSKG